MISIIIPVHNRADLLDITLESVSQQKDIVYETIVIDDNSTDPDVEKIVKKYNAKYIKNDTNQGAQKSRNTGVLNSQYEYIAFLDSDDLWHDPQKLLKQYQILSTRKDISIVYTALEYIDGMGKFISRQPDTQDIDHSAFIKAILNKDIIGTYSSVMMRKSVFIKSGMCNTALPARQDWDLWIRLSILGDAYKLGDSITQYRIHENQISSAHEKKIDGFSQLLLNHKQLFTDHALMNVYYKHLFKLILLSTIRDSISNNYLALVQQELPRSKVFMGLAKLVKLSFKIPGLGYIVKKVLATTYLFKGLK